MSDYLLDFKINKINIMYMINHYLLIDQVLQFIKVFLI